MRTVFRPGLYFPDVANELEFQGDVLKWMSLDIKKRPGIGISDVGQEKQYSNQKRSDLVIWLTRDVDALAAIELKTVTTPLNDTTFQNDVIKKARRVGHRTACSGISDRRWFTRPLSSRSARTRSSRSSSLRLSLSSTS